MAREPVPPHGYADPGPDEPADHAGRRPCAACGLMGQPGDGRHPVDGRPLAEVRAAARAARPARRAVDAVWRDAARARDAAILGERDQ
ncbi:hypothetical protein ACN27G_06120 [Plantactinospora sp. WMMB334]|uniref:hypothetical protein n=1 Tax=Plantactinospora sp. WMMB334 TaxID=3404119 RepID=UPI003B951E1A